MKHGVDVVIWWGDELAIAHAAFAPQHCPELPIVDVRSMLKSDHDNQ